MSEGHTFGLEQETLDGTRYQKCQRCGKVMFSQGDDYFNTTCISKTQDREELRKKLEGKL